MPSDLPRQYYIHRILPKHYFARLNDTTLYTTLSLKTKPERGDERVAEGSLLQDAIRPLFFLVSILRLGLHFLHGVSVRVPDEVARRGLSGGALQAVLLPQPRKHREIRNVFV